MQKIKVTSILLSCSFLLTTAISTSTVAMDRRDMEGVVYHTSPQYRLVDPERTTSSIIRGGLKEGHDAWKKNLAQKAERSYDIIKKTMKGDYGDLTGEIIEGFVANLMGQGLYHQFLESNTTFDPSLQTEVVAKIQMHLLSFLSRQIMKDTQRYGIVDGTGEHVTLYNNTSLFRMIAEKVGINQLPFGSVFITALDFDPVKKFMLGKFNQLALNQLSKLTEDATGATIKNHVGTQFVNLMNVLRKGTVNSARMGADLLFAPYEEVSISSSDVLARNDQYEPLWAYLEPHITHYLRQTFEGILNKTQVTLMNELTKKAQQSSAPLVRGGIKAGLTTMGGIAGYLMGGYSGGMGGLALGNTMSEFAGAYAAGMTHHQIEQFGKIADEQIGKFIQWKMHNLFKYSKEEHALYYLNPNQPTHLELALFAEDYKLRADLESKTAIGSVIEQLSHSFPTVNAMMKALNVTGDLAAKVGGRLTGLYKYFSSSSDQSLAEVMDISAVSSNQTSRDLEVALRQYVWLKKKSYLTSEEKLSLANIEKYPSFAIKAQFLLDLNEQLQTIHPETHVERMMKNKGTAKGKESEVAKIVEEVEKSVTDICSWYQHITRERWDQDYFDFINLEELLEKQVFLLPIKDQQRFLTIAKDEKYIRTFIEEAAKSEEKRAMLACSFEDSKDAKTVHNFLNQLLLGYSEFQYKGDIEKLQQHSFAERMSIEEMMALLESMPHRGMLHDAGLLSDVPHDVSRIVQKDEIAIIRTRFFELAQDVFARSYFDRYKAEARHYVRALASKEVQNLGMHVSAMQAQDIDTGATTISNTVDKEVVNDSSFRAFLIPIKEGENYKTFATARSKFYSLLKTQNKNWVKEFLEELKSKTGSTVESIDEKSSLEALINIVPVNDHISVYDETDVQGVKLAELYNQYMEEKGKSIEELEERDFIAIWNMLNEQKGRNLQNRNVSIDDLEFIAKYRTELLNIKQTTPRFSGKLFYGYMDLVNELRRKNAEQLENLNSEIGVQ